MRYDVAKIRKSRDANEWNRFLAFAQVDSNENF